MSAGFISLFLDEDSILYRYMPEVLALIVCQRGVKITVGG